MWRTMATRGVTTGAFSRTSVGVELVLCRLSALGAATARAGQRPGRLQVVVAQRRS